MHPIPVDPSRWIATRFCHHYLCPIHSHPPSTPNMHIVVVLPPMPTTCLQWMHKTMFIGVADEIVHDGVDIDVCECGVWEILPELDHSVPQHAVVVLGNVVEWGSATDTIHLRRSHRQSVHHVWQTADGASVVYPEVSPAFIVYALDHSGELIQHIGDVISDFAGRHVHEIAGGQIILADVKRVESFGENAGVRDQCSENIGGGAAAAEENGLGPAAEVAELVKLDV